MIYTLNNEEYYIYFFIFNFNSIQNILHFKYGTESKSLCFGRNVLVRI